MSVPIGAPFLSKKKTHGGRPIHQLGLHIFLPAIVPRSAVVSAKGQGARRNKRRRNGRDEINATVCVEVPRSSLALYKLKQVKVSKL